MAYNVRGGRAETNKRKTDKAREKSKQRKK